MKATLPYFLDTFTHFCIQQCCYFSVLQVGQGIRSYAGDFRFDDDAAAVVDGSTSGYGGGDVCVSALAHGKIVFVVEIEWALSVPIRFGQIGVVGSDNVGLRHVPTFLLREGETMLQFQFFIFGCVRPAGKDSSYVSQQTGGFS